MTEEKVTIAAGDVGEVSAADLGVEEKDPFEGCEPIPGHEHLGRVIRTPSGGLSASPANYEALRGATGEDLVGTPLSEEEEAELLAWLDTQIPPAV